MSVDTTLDSAVGLVLAKARSGLGATTTPSTGGGSPPPAPEVDSINMLIGDGTNVLTTGVVGALGVDFRSQITGVVLQEFDGTTGSIVIAIAKAQAGTSPSFSSIVASSPPTISTARYSLDTTLSGWTVLLDRDDILRFSVSSVTSIKRLLIKLRIRRLEP